MPMLNVPAQAVLYKYTPAFYTTHMYHPEIPSSNKKAVSAARTKVIYSYTYVVRRDQSSNIMRLLTALTAAHPHPAVQPRYPR